MRGKTHPKGPGFRKLCGTNQIHNTRLGIVTNINSFTLIILRCIVPH